MDPWASSRMSRFMLDGSPSLRVLPKTVSCHVLCLEPHSTRVPVLAVGAGLQWRWLTFYVSWSFADRTLKGYRCFSSRRFLCLLLSSSPHTSSNPALWSCHYLLIPSHRSAALSHNFRHLSHHLGKHETPLSAGWPSSPRAPLVMPASLIVQSPPARR